MRDSRRGVAVMALLAAIVCWRNGAAAPQHVTTVEGIAEYRLDNGLTLLLFPDPTRPVVTVNMTVLVGSRQEGYGEGGMAHLLEHMLFKGTPTFPDIDAPLRERGARYNGSTWVDRTNYFETLPAAGDNLEFALHMEADRLVNCPIRAEDLASEMTVVRNEFEIGENSPSSVLGKRMLGVAYEWHNYGRSTIGNESDVMRVPADALRRFYQKYYQPDNVVLIVAGRFEEATALELVQKYWGAIPKPERVLETTYTQEPPQDGERSVTLRRVGDVGLVAALYHVPGGSHEEFPAVSVLADILVDSPGGPLYKALVESGKAASVSGGASAFHDPGYMRFSATVRTDQSLDEVRQLLLNTIDQAASAGVTEEQVRRIQTRFAAERRRELTDTASLAVGLSEWAAQGDWRLYFLFRDRLEKVTVAEVNRVAKQYLRASNRTVGLFVPTKESDRTPVPPTSDVQTMVKDYRGREAAEPGEQLDPDPLQLESRISRAVLPSGLRVATLPKKSREEMVELQLTLRFGNEAESPRPELGHVVASAT